MGALKRTSTYFGGTTLTIALGARLCAIMSLIAASAFAAPVNYTITFTTSSGPAPTAGSFTYDSSAPLASRFTNFNVSWGGGIFDLTATANTGEQFTGTDCGTSPSSQSLFTFLSGQNVCANAAVIVWDGVRSTGIQTFDFRNEEASGDKA